MSKLVRGCALQGLRHPSGDFVVYLKNWGMMLKMLNRAEIWSDLCFETPLACGWGRGGEEKKETGESQRRQAAAATVVWV